jgi:hypothetical protein
MLGWPLSRIMACKRKYILPWVNANTNNISIGERTCADLSSNSFVTSPPLVQFFGVVDTSKLVLADNPSGRGTGQRWWSKECREAVAEHQAARKEWKHHRNDDALEPELREARNDSKKKLSKTVKKAKDDFYRNIVNDLTEPKQLFLNPSR